MAGSRRDWRVRTPHENIEDVGILEVYCRLGLLWPLRRDGRDPRTVVNLLLHGFTRSLYQIIYVYIWNVKGRCRQLYVQLTEFRLITSRLLLWSYNVRVLVYEQVYVYPIVSKFSLVCNWKLTRGSKVGENGEKAKKNFEGKPESSVSITREIYFIGGQKFL